MGNLDGDERVLALLCLDDIPLWSVKDVEQTSQAIINAYDYLMREGFDPNRERRTRRDRRPESGPQPRFL